MVQCNYNECTRNAYNSEEKCILHIEKNESSLCNENFHTTFYQELCSYIEKSALAVLHAKNYGSNHIVDELSISETLRSNTINNEQQQQNNTIKFLTEITLTIEDIDFPSIDTKLTTNNYCKILEKIGSIHFKKCKFWFCDKVFTRREKISYEECEFKTMWILETFSSSSSYYPYIYKSCVFKENVSFKSGSESTHVFHKPLFINCDFNKSLNIERIEFTALLFNNSLNTRTKIEQFNIAGCIFTNNFILNNCEIGDCIIKDTEIKSKFEFKNNKIQNNFEINNTNFSKLADMHGTKYLSEFEISKSIFKDLVVFEECEFGENYQKNAALFEYVTFEKTTNFRDAKFKSGLDIKNINPEGPINFLNADIGFDNTNRETFRIIKHSFDDIGNHIEANKFFVMEMKKYKDEVNKTGSCSDKIILYFNYITSDFGKSYVYPIVWMVILSVAYHYIRIGYQENLLYEIYTPANECFAIISNYLNYFAANMKIPLFTSYLKSPLDEGTEFLNLLFYILYSALIWLAIVAIKRRTKR